MIHAIQANRLFHKGWQDFLAYVVVNQDKELKIEDLPIVRDYVDVCPDDLPRLQPNKEIEFAIELVKGTKPISMAPYCMALAKFNELKVQLQEILDKCFIHLSVSP